MKAKNHIKSLGDERFEFETVTRRRLTDSAFVVELGLQDLVVFQQPVVLEEQLL